MNKSEMENLRVELSKRFDIANERFGTALNVNAMDGRQCNTWKRFLEAIDSLEDARKDIAQSVRDTKLTVTNIARVGGLSESTISHNDHMKRIVDAISPSEDEEKYISIAEHKRKVREITEDIEELKRRQTLHERTCIELYAANRKIEQQKEEIKRLQDNAEDLYDKVQHIMESDSDAKKVFTDYLPELMACFSTQSKASS